MVDAGFAGRLEEEGAGFAEEAAAEETTALEETAAADETAEDETGLEEPAAEDASPEIKEDAEADESEVDTVADTPLARGVSLAETVQNISPTARDTHDSAKRLFLLPEDLGFIKIRLSPNKSKAYSVRQFLRFFLFTV